jgi:hypothetical protein
MIGNISWGWSGLGHGNLKKEFNYIEKASLNSSKISQGSIFTQPRLVESVTSYRLEMFYDTGPSCSTRVESRNYSLKIHIFIHYYTSHLLTKESRNLTQLLSPYSARTLSIMSFHVTLLSMLTARSEQGKLNINTNKHDDTQQSVLIC